MDQLTFIPEVEKEKKICRETCLQCGGPIPKERQRPGTKYCHGRCSEKFRYYKEERNRLPPSRKNCLFCLKPIPKEKQRPGVRFCSDKCARSNYDRQQISIEGADVLNQATLGIIGESIVCIDLTRKGYLVFRAFSPACPYDLVILKDGKFETVEARVGRKTKTGKAIFKKEKIRADLLAIVLRDEIIYQKKV